MRQSWESVSDAKIAIWEVLSAESNTAAVTSRQMAAAMAAVVQMLRCVGI